MILYKAEKGNIGFYIQPDMITSYVSDGYKVMVKDTLSGAEEEVKLPEESGDIQNE